MAKHCTASEPAQQQRRGNLNEHAGFDGCGERKEPMMQKPKPYRSPRRQPAPRTLLPRRLRRAATQPLESDLDIVFEWEMDEATQH